MQHRLAVAGLLCVLLAAPSAAGEVVRVAINDLAFSPAEVTAKVGDTIEWVNGDFVDHTATAKDGSLGRGHCGRQVRAVAAHDGGHVCLLLQSPSWHDGEHPCRRKVTDWPAGTCVALLRRALADRPARRSKRPSEDDPVEDLRGDRRLRRDDRAARGPLRKPLRAPYGADL